ncbi:hypothetical protein NDU88_004588 [Pleurodeles waltl]|uniref:Uncharacterized protein n=1 Tax=Pleurodeles waltl TaxID=8319 RepID=A0AAV7RHS5_PLEWA|nr:hypothetical protein NDU88_004588 [Pleurodeles waltl]
MSRTTTSHMTISVSPIGQCKSARSPMLTTQDTGATVTTPVLGYDRYHHAGRVPSPSNRHHRESLTFCCCSSMITTNVAFPGPGRHCLCMRHSFHAGFTVHSDALLRDTSGSHSLTPDAHCSPPRTASLRVYTPIMRHRRPNFVFWWFGAQRAILPRRPRSCHGVAQSLLLAENQRQHQAPQFLSASCASVVAHTPSINCCLEAG